MCILYPPKVTAIACYVLAQRIFDGPHSPSLDARISAAAPSASLPTPPSHNPPSPDASRYAIEYFTSNDGEISSVSGLNSCHTVYVNLICLFYYRGIEHSAGVLLFPRCTNDFSVSFFHHFGMFHAATSIITVLFILRYLLQHYPQGLVCIILRFKVYRQHEPRTPC